MTFKESIPNGLYDLIVEHLRKVCKEKTISSWKHNVKKEDSITGAFFEGISKLKGDYLMNPNWEWSIDYNSFSSISEEPHLGADGLFQIEVEDSMSKGIFRKGFLFQSKKLYNVENQKTRTQLMDIERHVKNGSLLITYDENKYSAITGTTYLNDPSSWMSNNENLCAFLITKFLTCNFGIKDLHYDFNKRMIMLENEVIPIKPKDVATIKVKKKRK